MCNRILNNIKNAQKSPAKKEMRKIFLTFFVEIDERFFYSARIYLLVKKTKAKNRSKCTVFFPVFLKLPFFGNYKKTQYLVITY